MATMVCHGTTDQGEKTKNAPREKNKKGMPVQSPPPHPNPTRPLFLSRKIGTSVVGVLHSVEGGFWPSPPPVPPNLQCTHSAITNLGLRAKASSSFLVYLTDVSVSGLEKMTCTQCGAGGEGWGWGMGGGGKMMSWVNGGAHVARRRMPACRTGRCAQGGPGVGGNQGRAVCNASEGGQGRSPLWSVLAPAGTRCAEQVHAVSYPPLFRGMPCCLGSSEKTRSLPGGSPAQF